MNILAVIPARSGSKRLPGKNVRPLGGKPLLLWTVDAALEAKRRLAPEHRLDICLSTDSLDYMEILRKHLNEGLKMSFSEAGVWEVMREGELAEDCDTALVIKHAAYEMEKASVGWDDTESRLTKGVQYDAFITLQPTSPFRSWKDITDCVNMYVSSQNTKLNHDCVFTVRPVTEFPQWMFRAGGSGVHSRDAKSFLGIPTRYLSGIIAQDLPELYFPNGAVYLTKRQLIVTEKPRIYGDRCIFVPMDAVRSVDIEEEADFAYAEWLLQHGKVNLL